MIPRLGVPWKDKKWSAEYKDLKSMDFHKDSCLTLSGAGVAVAKPGHFSSSDIPSSSASWIRVLCWTCGFMLLFCQLQVLFGVSPHQMFAPQGLRPHLQCTDSAVSAALLCPELTAGFVGGRCWLLFYFFKQKPGTGFFPASSSPLQELDAIFPSNDLPLTSRTGSEKWLF